MKKISFVFGLLAIGAGLFMTPIDPARAAEETRVVKFGVVDVELIERESLMNKDIATQINALRNKLSEEVKQEEAALRKGLVGSGDRSDRIRTYNFPQGRLTDHRINLTLYKLGMVMEGQLDEVLDALPVEAVRWDDTGIFSRGVSVDQQGALSWSLRPATATLLQGAQRICVPTPYDSELGLQAQAWIHSLGESLQRGVIFLIDYGFAEQEFWHPQRNTGTLMCHYRHHAHTDPFYLPGLQDITAHIDFSACARAAQAAGLDVLGYTTQASFLIDAGLLNVLARTDPNETRYPALAGQAQCLLSPAEMGELFKVLCLGRAMTAPPGFGRGDR